jgi:hypothetical protein
LKKPKNAALELNRKNFDACFIFMRETASNIGGVHCSGSGGGGGTRFQSAPTVSDLRADISKVVDHCLKSAPLRARFLAVYCSPHGLEGRLDKFAQAVLAPYVDLKGLLVGIAHLLAKRNIWMVGRGSARYLSYAVSTPAGLRIGTVLPKILNVPTGGLAVSREIARKAEALRKKYSAALLRDISEVEEVPDVEIEPTELTERTERTEPTEREYDSRTDDQIRAEYRAENTVRECGVRDPFLQHGLDFDEVETV